MTVLIQERQSLSTMKAGFSVGLPPDVLIKALDARTGDITDDQ